METTAQSNVINGGGVQLIGNEDLEPYCKVDTEHEKCSGL